jgi:hypothetical protein
MCSVHQVVPHSLEAFLDMAYIVDQKQGIYSGHIYLFKYRYHIFGCGIFVKVKSTPKKTENQKALSNLCVTGFTN